MHTYIHAYILTYIHTYIRTHLHTYTHVHIYLLAYLHPYIHGLARGGGGGHARRLVRGGVWREIGGTDAAGAPLRADHYGAAAGGGAAHGAPHSAQLRDGPAVRDELQ